MLLKGSQVTSLQQREITMQKRLYQTLHYAYENISIHFSVTLPASQTLLSSTLTAHAAAANNVSHFSGATHSPEITLPELLNITRSCFEDIVKWEHSLKLNHSSVGGFRKKYQQEDEQQIERGLEEEENQGVNHRRTDSGMVGREPFLRRKPPTIPRR